MSQTSMPDSFVSEENLAHLEAEAAQAADEMQTALVALHAIKDEVSAWRGRRADPRAWSDLLDRQRLAGARHQRASARVADFKRRIKAVQTALYARRAEANRAEGNARELGFAEHFLNTARRLLDPDVFAGLMREATLEKNRALIPKTPNLAAGAAMGVRGGASGFRERKSS